MKYNLANALITVYIVILWLYNKCKTSTPSEFGASTTLIRRSVHYYVGRSMWPISASVPLQSQQSIKINDTSVVGDSWAQPLSCVMSCTENQYPPAVESGIFDQHQAININSSQSRIKKKVEIFSISFHPWYQLHFSFFSDWCVINFTLDESSRRRSTRACWSD